MYKRPPDDTAEIILAQVYETTLCSPLTRHPENKI